MKVGIGFSNEIDALVSGKKIAELAVDSGEIQKPKFAIAFCSADVNAGELLTGIKEVIGTDIPVVGGSGIGIITNNTISYDNHSAGIVVVEDDDIEIHLASATGLDKSELQVGRNLANQLTPEEDDVLILFFDSIKTPPENNKPPIMNSSRPLLQGIEEIIAGKIPIVGGGTIGDYDFSSTIQFSKGRIQSQAATALLLRGDIHADWRIMHGCSPKDGIYHTITKIEGPVLHEVDNRPIIEVINEMYGSEDWQKQLPVKRLSIGVNHGDKFNSSWSEADYVNRLIIGPLPDKSGIVLFEADLEEGSEIQFMLRDTKTMIQSARINTEILVKGVISSGKTPKWGLYIDCAGRTAMASECLTEEASEVQTVFNNNNIPLFGFYSGVEIAPFQNKNRGLDWTGVLILFSK